MNGETEPKRKIEPLEPDRPENEVFEEFRHRLALAPDNTELRLHLAQLLARHGRRLQALEELRVLVRLDPNHLVARKLREELMRETKDPTSGLPAASQTSEALH